MLKKIIICSLALLCFSCTKVKEKPDNQAANSQYAPVGLAQQTLDFDITEASSKLLPESQYAKSGKLKSFFDNKISMTDARDIGGFSFSGDYTYERTSKNEATIIQKISDPQGKEMLFSTKLNFSSSSGGNFETETAQDKNILLTHKGKFVVSNTPLEVLPTGLIHNIITFHIEKLDTQSSDTPFKVGDKIEANFSSPTQVDFTVGTQKYTSNDYKLSPVNVFNKVFQGTIVQNKASYQVTLSFTSFRTGTFVLELNGGKTRATGNFDKIKYSAIAPTELKGKLVEGNSFTSKITKISYPYTVYLPPGYSTSKKAYPIIYVTDGQWHKGFFNALDARNKETIMVAIDQGPNDRRMTDYNLPGATAYTKFLKKEFIPFIESRYRTTKSRSFFGASLGGTLGGILVSQETGGKPYFKNYILADGAFWALTPEIVAAEEARYKANKNLPIKLLLSATLQGNALPTSIYEKRFRDRGYEGITIINKEYKLSHEEMAPPTFIEYLDLIE